MKKKLLLLGIVSFSALSFVLCGCASRRAEITPVVPVQMVPPEITEASGVKTDTPGTVAVMVCGYGYSESDFLIEAQKKAFNVILFRGVPGSSLTAPLIANEKQALEKNGAFFSNFFATEYKTFLLASQAMPSTVGKNGFPEACAEITINHNSLRAELEQQKVIRKFGY